MLSLLLRKGAIIRRESVLRRVQFRDLALLVRLRTSEDIQAQLIAPQFSTSIFSALAWIHRSVSSKRRVFRVISVSRWKTGIGFLVLFLPENPYDAPLVGLAIRPNHQGGAGAIAMIEAIRLAKNMGFEAIRLSVRVDNLRARNLHESLGFRPVSRETRTYFQGSVPTETMELSLGKKSRKNLDT